MKYKNIISILTILIALLAGVAAAIGIFSTAGDGPFEYLTIRGETITTYGVGVYQHMSDDVAIQGIAQDYISLFIAIPALLISLYFARKGSIRAQLLNTGVAAYFFVTYLFYLCMGMYNYLFLAYTALLCITFFNLALSLFSLSDRKIQDHFNGNTPTTLCGTFLIINTVLIFLLWLSSVVPPLLDGSLYPDILDHYTTLIVQGLDMGLLLPLSALSGMLLIKRRPLGYLLAPVYLVFLIFLMAALIAKITSMGLHGVPIIPAIFIIPTIELFTLFCVIRLMRSLRD